MTAEILDFPNSIDLQLERISQQDKRQEQKREHEIGRLRIVLERTERTPCLEDPVPTPWGVTTAKVQPVGPSPPPDNQGNLASRATPPCDGGWRAS
jgi:hypothetical protein